MKKTASLILGTAIFLGHPLFPDQYTICKTFAYDEDSVSLLQSEIVAAKEKQRAISDKSQVMAKALDVGRVSRKKTDADELMEEMIHDGSARGPDNVKIIEKKTAAKSAPKKPVKVPEKKSWSWPPKPYKEKKVTDADVAYKVAISDNKITADEAVEIGLAGNLQVRAAAQKIEVAKGKLTEANRALFPTVQGTAIYNAGGKQPQSAPPPFFRSFKTNSYKVNVSQPVYYGGELKLTSEQAEQNVKAAEAEHDKIKNEYVQQVKTAYYAAVKAEYNVQYEAELYEDTNAVYRRVLGAHREKLISEIDYLNAESQYQQVYFQAESSQNDLKAASMALRQAISINDERAMPLDLKLDFRKVRAVFDDIYELAEKNNPDFSAKRHALEAARLGILIYEAKKRPHFDLRGSYGMMGERILDDQSHADLAIGGQEIDFNMNKEWFLGIKGSMPLGPNSVEWEKIKHVFAPTVISPTGGSEDWSDRITFNLLDKFSDLTDAKNAYALFLQAQADFKKAKDDLAVKVREDIFNLQKSLIQVDSSMAKIRYQEKQNSIMEYLVGLQETPAANLLEGYIELTQARFSFIQAVIEYKLAESDLSLATGDMDYFKKKRAL